jgi:predicted metal-dependent phosphoesterase TrpH
LLIDTHVHTAETSRCAKMSARDLVETYRRMGYDGFVVTDHMKSEDFRGRELFSWHRKAEQWLSGYHAAQEAARDGFAVLLGMEIRFMNSINDYLLFGIDEDFVLNNPNLHKYEKLSDFYPLAKKHDALIVQAHPFRIGMMINDWKLLDGLEVFNGGVQTENNNEIARQWAEIHGLIQTAGSDYHGWVLPNCGLRLEGNIQTSAQLTQILREGKYSIAKV